jgi:hypothetical protein
MEQVMSVPWAKLLDRPPDSEWACVVLCNLLHVFHAQYFTNGDHQAAARELADLFTELATKYQRR